MRPQLTSPLSPVGNRASGSWVRSRAPEGCGAVVRKHGAVNGHPNFPPGWQRGELARVFPGSSSTKTKIALIEPVEGCAVRTGHVGIERLSGGDEPRIILAQTARRPALQQRTPPSLREVHTLKDETLQRGQSCCLVGSTLKDLFNADYGENQPATAQPGQQPPCGALFASRGFTVESDQEGTVEQYGAAQRFLCANPNPFPSEALTHSIRSSAVSIGPARSIRARMTSDFGTLPRRAQRARSAARFLSSLTVIVGMVIPIYYHRRELGPGRLST